MAQLPCRDWGHFLPQDHGDNSTSCSLLVPPGPELLYPKKDIFPKAVWAEGERHHYNPTPAPPSRTTKENKSHNPVVASTLTHRWQLKREGRAGHSHGKGDRNTTPSPTALQSPSPCAGSTAARQGTPGALAPIP